MSRNISKYKKSLSNVDSKNSFHTKNDPHSRHVSREINNLIGDLYEKKKDFTSIKEKQTEDLINISNSQLVELVNREVENRNLPDDFDLDGINLEECFRSQFKKNKSPESIEDKFLRFSSKRIKDMEREPLLSQENFWNGVDLNRFIYDTVSQKKMKEISPASNNWEKRIQIQKETDFNINSVQNNQGYLTKQSTVDVQIPFRQLHSLKENCVQLFDFFIDKCKEIEILKMELRELREVVNLRNNFLPNSLYRSKNVEENAAINPICKSNAKKRFNKETNFQVLNIINEEKEFDKLLSNLKSNRKDREEFNNSDPIHFNNKQESVDIKKIEDKDFDDFLKNCKDKKGLKILDDPFTTGNQINQEQIVKDQETKQFTTDFISNNQAAVCKINPRVQKMMEEMEKDMPENDMLIDQEEEKKTFEPSKFAKKRNYAEHTKTVNSLNKVIPKDLGLENDKKAHKVIQASNSNNSKNNNPGFKISAIPNKPNTKVKEHPNKKSLDITIPKIEDKNFTLDDIHTCEFLCLCVSKEKSEHPCEICEGDYKITKKNFLHGFQQMFKEELSDHKEIFDKNEKEIKNFFFYQHRLVCWKYYILSKFFCNKAYFSLNKIYLAVFRKFTLTYIEGKRSFLTKVAEKDSSINKNMVLLVTSLKQSEENYTIELSDGYKSVFTLIKSNNPIVSLIQKKILFTGMKLNIGLAKIDKIDDDFNVYINIFYNSISKADINSKLGLDSKRNKFLLRNLGNLKEDGGEVSMIDVIVLKKYDYYCYDFAKKTKLSKAKLEKIIQMEIEKLEEKVEKARQMCLSQEEISYENKTIDAKKNFQSEKNQMVKGKISYEKKDSIPNEQINFYQNIIFTFKIICIDSLMYMNYTNEVELKRNLKQKLQGRRCVIEFNTKNLNIINEITVGNRYQFMLLNNGKVNTSYFPDSQTLRLKANDSTLYSEIKYPSNFKKTPSYTKMIREFKESLGVKTELQDISEVLMKTNFIYSNLINEEFSFTGIYLNKFIKLPKLENSHNNEQLYFFFVNKDNNLVLLRIHDELFFELSKLLSSNNQHQQQVIYHFDNVIFKIVNQFDAKLNILTSYKPEASNVNSIINIETNNYTAFKSISVKGKTQCEITKQLQNKISSNDIYDENTLDRIMNSLR